MVVTLYAARSPRCAEPSTSPEQRLRTLLDLAATIDLDDEAASRWLRDEACVAIDALIAAGVVPHHLAIRIDELPVVVRRTIAAAYRRATTPG